MPDLRSLGTRSDPDDSDKPAVRFGNEYGVSPNVIS